MKLMEQAKSPPAILTAPAPPAINGSAPFRQGRELFIPALGGVYLVHDLRGVLYAGRSVDLRRRFSQHYWECANPFLSLAVSNPVGDLTFSWILADEPFRGELEAQLIAAYSPPCNRLKPTKGN